MDEYPSRRDLGGRQALACQWAGCSARPFVSFGCLSKHLQCVHDVPQSALQSSWVHEWSEMERKPLEFDTVTLKVSDSAWRWEHAEKGQRANYPKRIDSEKCAVTYRGFESYLGDICNQAEPTRKKYMQAIARLLDIVEVQLEPGATVDFKAYLVAFHRGDFLRKIEGLPIMDLDRPSAFKTHALGPPVLGLRTASRRARGVRAVTAQAGPLGASRTPRAALPVFTPRARLPPECPGARGI